MPELPDVTVYVERLSALVGGQHLLQVRIANPFLLRTVEPPLTTFCEKIVRDFQRMGKRIVMRFDDELYLVLHLMVAGRLHWKTGERPKLTAKATAALFEFERGTLVLTEAGSKKRASLHAVKGADQLNVLNPDGLEVLDASLEEFRSRLLAENHTLKRSLTDPHIFSGIGNSYSDEILYQARLSPVLLTQRMSAVEVQRLYDAIRTTLSDWTATLRAEAGEGFPEKVTAFRKGMAVHGRFGKPCPVCATPVQRIRYAENETNYCPTCQTGGKLLADRALSRLLKGDWPRSLEELEQRKAGLRGLVHRGQRE
jgi:formamidopyrimidine-DNA glycosylase